MPRKPTPCGIEVETHTGELAVAADTDAWSSLHQHLSYQFQTRVFPEEARPLSPLPALAVLGQ